MLIAKDIDRFVAFIALIILSPLLCVVCLLVLLRLGPPILFIQKRVGYKGVSFYLSIRTMSNARDGSSP